MATQEDSDSKLSALVCDRRVAALGTLHQGVPFVSMVPYALLDGAGFIIHVSGLASHTKDMRSDPRVSLLVMDDEKTAASPLALPRVTISGLARELAAGSDEHAQARKAYQQRFPESATIFALPDFRLFLIVPQEARLVLGFGRAATLAGEAFWGAIRSGRASGQ